MVKRADGQCNTVTTKYFTEKTHSKQAQEGWKISKDIRNSS